MSKTKALAKASAGSVAIEAKSPDDQKYETKRHLETLSDAHDIMNDPVKLKKVHAMVGRHKKAITSIAQLKEIRNKKALGEEENE